MANPTVQELVDYYVNLLIKQYHDKDKAKAHIDALITDIVSNALPFDIRDGFDPETAVGAQLDLIDKYVGVGRYYDGEYIDDDVFRFLLLFKVIQNNSDHSLDEIDDSLYEFFDEDVLLSSEGKMHEGFFLDTSVEEIYEIALGKGIIPRPTGVKIEYSTIKPASGKVFCISYPDGTYPYPDLMGGFDEGLFAEMLGAATPSFPRTFPHSF